VIALGLLGCASSKPAPTPIASNTSSAAATTASSPPSTGHPQIDDSKCPLHWDELVAPPTIPLVAASTPLGDDCPQMDVAALLAPGGCKAPDCISATIDGRATAFVMEGPGGSGRFASLGLALADSPPRYASATASTVGWRHLAMTTSPIAPLPWYADVSGDGRVELVVWQRLPWGSSEADNGLVPIVYALEGDALVRRDPLGAKLAAKVAAAYRSVPTLDQDVCAVAMVKVLEHWPR
jgi:hypothetical protein